MMKIVIYGVKNDDKKEISLVVYQVRYLPAAAPFLKPPFVMTAPALPAPTPPVSATLKSLSLAAPSKGSCSDNSWRLDCCSSSESD